MRRADRLPDALEVNAEPIESYQDQDAEQYEDALEDLNAEVDGNDSSLKDQFYEDLQDYLDVSGAEIELHPVVDGREVELWDLFSVATQQDCAGEDRDWKTVAQRLGFDWTSSAGCVKDLKECYDRNLAEFEEAIGSYDDQEDTAMVEDEQASQDDEEQGIPRSSDAVTAPKEPAQAALSPYRSSSPVTGVKRSFQQSNDPQSELSYPSDGSSKRRRRDRGKPIPQTPDHELRLAGGSGSRAAAQDFSSPLKSRGAAARLDDLYSADDADDFLDNGRQDNREIDELPELAPPRKKRFIEPETQDFGAVMGANDAVRQSIEENNMGYATDEDDISPSQQLQSEFEAFSSPGPSVPVRGNGIASATRPSFADPGPRPLRGPAKERQTSAPGTATINPPAKGSAAYNSSSTLRATKRSLPQQYQIQPAIPAAARPPASAPARNGIVAAPLQSRPPVVTRPTVASAHNPDVVIQKSRQRVSATSSRTAQSPVQSYNHSMGAPTSSAPVSNPADSRAIADSTNFGAEYVDAQFEHFVALGYAIRDIGPAMEVASLQRGPMTVALHSLQKGKGIPQDEAGVWTDDDDEKLRKVRGYDRRQKSGAPSSEFVGNAAEKAEVEGYRSFLRKKHGSWIHHRLAFMDMMDKDMAAR